MVKQIRGQSGTFGSGVSSPSRGFGPAPQHRGRSRCSACVCGNAGHGANACDVDEDPTFANDSSSDGSRKESPVHRRDW